jgi:hypothetical protein
MATVVNDRDVLIMGTAPRFNPPTDRGMFLTPASAVFKVASNGLTASPSSFTFTATLLNMTGAVTWSYTGGISLSINGNTATLSYASFSAVSGTITASITVDGQSYAQTVTVSKVADGTTGPQGSRGNVDIAAVTTGSVWSDSEAVAALVAAGYGAPQVRDMVNLYKADRTFGAQKMYNGSAWVTVDYVWNGNVFVKGSILPEAIDTRGLTIKDAQGNIILGSGTGLPASYFAATLGGDNLMRNSSFEVQTANNRPDGYGAYNNAGISASYVVVTGRLGGKAFGIRANATGATTWGLWSGNDIVDPGATGGVAGGWQPNKTYIISFKAKKVNGASLNGIALQWNTPPANTVWVSRPALSTSWQTYTVRVTWGGSVEAAGHLYIDSNNNGAGSSVAINDEFHVDELIIQEGDVYSEWFPSSAEAKAAADTANATLTAIADDNVLSKGEKSAAVAAWNAVDAEWASLIAQADILGVSRSAYNTAHQNLSTYLLSITPSWSDTTTDSPISGATWRTNWTAYYDEKQKLINALTAKASNTSTWAGVVGRPSDDQIKNNLIDLSWWQRLGTIPWAQNMEFNVLGNSLADYGIVGPKGGDDVVWYAKEVNNDGNPGGGWNDAVANLNPAKTYRFVIPIRKKSGSGTAYWGTGGVATLNTTAGVDNPYFAYFSTGTGGMQTDRWYLFVGYIYPAGSTGNVNDNAGVWDCKTGQKVLNGTNYNFLPGSGNVYFRAYQYYSSNGAEQLFGRPMINLVDGAEPSLREYFESGAVLNTAITIGADGALSGAGGGKVTLPGMGQNTYRVITIGGSFSGSLPAAVGFYANGTLNSSVSGAIGRSYNVIVLNRSTGAVVSTTQYDVYGSGQANGLKASDMAAALNALGADKVVVVVSYDEPHDNRLDSGLNTAMYRCGASRAVYGSSNFQYRSAYVLIGIPGCGEGNGAEAYQGAISADPNAWVDVSFSLLNGSLIGVTANYTPRSLVDYGYTGDLNATSDLVLVGRGTTITGNTITKTQNTANWDADAYSKDSFTGGAYASAVAVDTVNRLMFGLNSDPTTDSSYASLDYAILLEAGNNPIVVQVYESGNFRGSFGAWVAGDVLAVVYDGSSVKYLKNGGVFYTSTIGSAPNQVLYFDSSFNTPGATLKNVRFGPMSSNNWANIGGANKAADNATVGATIGTNLFGQITSGNASTYIANAAIASALISDLRTANYAEDGSGNPTAGAKLASTGTALKVANSSFQVGSAVFSDYWFRLVQAIDGNRANGRVIWRGNNDSTTRGGAPDIGRLSVTFISSQVVQSNFQQIYHGFKLTPSGYSTYTDNLDAMQQIHVQLFQSTSSTSPFTEFYWPCPSRTYDGTSGIVQGSWSWGWRFSGAGSLSTINSSLEMNGLFTGCMRVRLANSYGWSATQDFAGGAGVNQQLAYTTITGLVGSSGGGSGGTSNGGGGACPAPWVKVRLINGTEVSASDLHVGAVVAAVNDSTLEALPRGGVIRDCCTIWAQRYRVTLTDGRATEWSENHRFAVADRGWVHVQHLRPGDRILGLEESIVQTVLATGTGQAISFRVDGAGTYFAGGMLCHNYKMLP